MVFQCEKLIKDSGDKLSDEDKTSAQAEIDKVKEALKGTDSAAIKAASEALTAKMQEIGTKIYSQAQTANADPNAEAQNNGGDNVQDADYKEV